MLPKTRPSSTRGTQGRKRSARPAASPQKRRRALGAAYEIGETSRDRNAWPPTMTSVHTTIRKGIGVSLRSRPLAAIASAAHAPITSGRNNAHRVLMSNPATSASARKRMMVMRRDCHIVPSVSRGGQRSHHFGSLCCGHWLFVSSSRHLCCLEVD